MVQGKTHDSGGQKEKDEGMAREPGPSKEKSPSALNSVTDHDSTLLGEVRRLLTRLDVLSGLHTASGHADSFTFHKQLYRPDREKGL